MPKRFSISFDGFKNLNIGISLVFCVLILVLIGLVVLASATLSFVDSTKAVFNKQLLRLGLALFLGVFMFYVDLEKLRKWVPYVGLISLLMLVAVLIPGLGVKVNGARRWLGLGFMRLEVAELVKFGLIFCLAHYLSVNQRHMAAFRRGFFVPSFIIGVVCILILAQPDFGTAFLCGLVGFSMLFLAGARLVFIVPSLISAGMLFFVAVLFNPVRLKRLTSFLDVEANKLDGTYQLWQGMLAFGAGGVDGVGLGNGRQQLSFLPEAHTDFIFPIIGEELGFFFTSGVVIIYFIVFLLGLLILKQAPNMFYFTLLAGSTLCIVFQAIINICVVTGLMPTKGMSLPFISYGGSNLLLMFMLIGIMLNCLRTWTRTPLVEAREL